MRLLFTLFVAAIAFTAGVWYMGGFDSLSQSPEPASVATSTPAEPVTPASAQAVYDNASPDRIQVTAPSPGATAGSTFAVTGQARGYWYFEASFPYEVQDANGVKIAGGPVQASSEWMTTEFVPFALQISVPNYKGKATLILRNDNPSGLPENAASVSIPIVIQ